MSERDHTAGEDAPEPGPDPHAEESASVDANLSDLRARLDELQQSVEQLGAWTPDPIEVHDPYAAPASDPYQRPAPYEDAPPYQPPAQTPGYPEPPGYDVPPAYADPQVHHDVPSPYEPSPYEPSPYEPSPYEPSPYEPPSYEPPVPEPYTPPPQPGVAAGGSQPGYSPGFAEPPPPPIEAPLTYPAPPAATNGHGTASVDPAEISARSATVAMVEAGPFADLIELRHFEDDLAALGAVRDVRVRRFGHGRAAIEVAMTGPHALSRELYQLNRPMQVSDGPEGEVLIELAPLPEREQVEPAPPGESREEGSP